MTPLGGGPLMDGSLPSGAVAGFQQIMPAEMLAADTASYAVSCTCPSPRHRRLGPPG